jgi:hypothetical protein
MGSAGAFNVLYIPAAFVVPGDAGATARRITESAFTYRLVVLSGLVSSIAFVLLVVTLYELLKDADRTQAMLMVVFVTVAAAGGVVNLVNQIAPLLLLSGSDFLSAFSRPQLEALALAFLRLNGYGNVLVEAFWGLWLFPLGILVLKSRLFPRILGLFLIAACFAYLASSFTSIVLPEQGKIVSRAAIPFEALGEVSFLLWLLVRGVKAPAPIPG